eukprot:TRINITY_DN7651_c0_g1_i2.p1 TRINITY_DN7651_c0_g1~~TRINITY_DN7651_c0_g1_i2.p1  ORF type:complete len:479 (+),score=57.63 TRINITY_DN7651_c0_g1_i2:467-1903(+)
MDVGGLLVTLLCFLVGVLFVAITLLRWNEMKYRQPGLPPGTMGWPLFGETSDFIRNGQQFIKTRRSRYGDMFKSHILGCPTIICTDPSLNRYILMNEGKGFVPGYPQSMQDLLGKWNIASVQNSLHKLMRGTMLSLINPSLIKTHLLADVDEFMDSYLRNWENQVIQLQDKTKEMALLISLRQVMSLGTGSMAKEYKREFYKLLEGSLSMPLNFPGTNYRRGLRAREKIIQLLSNEMRERLSSKKVYNDMIGCLLKEQGGDAESLEYSKLTEEQIMDLAIAIINAGHETVSTTTMMALKYLHDHPEALTHLREEHQRIYRNRKPGQPISWEEFKEMTFTRNVIYETLRLANVVNGVLRKTTQDIDLKGYRIPKGWKIYVYITDTNRDSNLYPDPLKFNPWRWEQSTGDSSLYFMAFGGGSRLCPGKELGIAEISIFLHYFVTRYRWEEVGDEKLVYFPRVGAEEGLRVNVYSNSDNYD